MTMLLALKNITDFEKHFAANTLAGVRYLCSYFSNCRKSLSFLAIK